MWNKKGAERAAPEISRAHLQETLERDKVVQEIVQREVKETHKNNLGPRIHRAFGGLH